MIEPQGRAGRSPTPSCPLVTTLSRRTPPGAYARRAGPGGRPGPQAAGPTAAGQRKLDGRAEARLIALACSAPPEGRKAWTMRLLADKLVELEVVDSISDETVRRALKKTS